MALSGTSSPSFFALICILSVANNVVTACASDQWLLVWPLGAQVPRFLLKIFLELEDFPKTALANSFLFENTAIHTKAFNLSSLFSVITVGRCLSQIHITHKLTTYFTILAVDQVMSIKSITLLIWKKVSTKGSWGLVNHSFTFVPYAFKCIAWLDAPNGLLWGRQNQYSLHMNHTGEVSACLQWHK